jgi:hypothetical protein
MKLSAVLGSSGTFSFRLPKLLRERLGRGGDGSGAGVRGCLRLDGAAGACKNEERMAAVSSATGGRVLAGCLSLLTSGRFSREVLRESADATRTL